MGKISDILVPGENVNMANLRDWLGGLCVRPDEFASVHDDSDSEQIAAAIAYSLSPDATSKGRVDLLGREYELAKTIFVPSSVQLHGTGPETLITFDGVLPSTLTGTSHTNPRWGNLRTAAFAFAGTATDDMGASVYADGQTGDYFTAEARAFAASTTLEPGATSFVAASSGLVSDLTVGDWLWLSTWIAGWHSAVNEAVQITGISGTTVSHTPTRNRYTNNTADAAFDFFTNVATPYYLGPNFGGGTAPGTTGQTGWRQCGFRPIVPVIGSGLHDLRIRNVNDYSDYANLAFGVFRSLNFRASGIVIEAGAVWNLDSQGSVIAIDRIERIDPSHAQVKIFAGNGSNGVDLTVTSLKDCNVVIEEGASSVTVRLPSAEQRNSVVQVIQFCSDITVQGAITNRDTYGIKVYLSSRVRFEGTTESAGAGFWHDSPALFENFPEATLAHWQAMHGFFDDAYPVISASSRLRSFSNNGLEIYYRSPVRVESGAVVGGDAGDAYDLGATAAGRIVGSLSRGHDGLRAGAPIVSAKPTFFPQALESTAPDATNDKVWRIVNYSRKTVFSVSSTTVIVVNSNTTDGGIKAGDLCRVLIENTATVSITRVEPGKAGDIGHTDSYASGAARKWHVSVVNAINTGSGEVTLTTAVPANWAAKTGSDGVAFFARWA